MPGKDVTNIVLIGYPGVGKSSIGRGVAEAMGLPFLDTDEMIVAREGRPITKIFRESGESHFRRLEHEIIARVSEERGTVISTGGGCVLDERNVENLRRRGMLVFLSATPEAIYDRIKDQEERPLLLGKSRWELAEKVRLLMKRRAFQYLRTTNVIDVTCLTAPEIIDRIVRLYRGELSIRLVGLIGSKLETTLSPLMHNAAFHYQKLDFHYQCFETDDLAAIVARVRELGIAGFNVTFPYKTIICEYLDELSGVAAAIGAVNTVYHRDGRLIGDNTDSPGALEHLRAVLAYRRSGYELAGKRALVLGTGGAARALVHALSTACCKVCVLGRDRAKAETVGNRFGVEWGDLSELGHQRPDILVNATVVGMGETAGRSLVPEDCIVPGQIVFDVVYFPMQTELLRAAVERGAMAVDGVGMLVRQGALSYHGWTGKKPPLLLMERVVRQFLKNQEGDS
ncbi:shikimate dehydrogenase [bacterium]|nr:shikimate dehydrogenase [candidate division CSSED10-310 bacterium]